MSLSDALDAAGRLPLFQRLPEVYRIRDAEQDPPGQFQAYVGLLERLFAALHADVDRLHGDLFIDTCRDWVIPYLADLLGTSHLSGDPWTLRADVARTIKHRRRKGTLGALESLAHALSGWAVHATETWPRLLWNQHLNHQRPDAGGAPPLSLPSATISGPARGGTVNLRDPAQLTLLGGPFDPFGHMIDLKPGGFPNLPTLALFLWRLRAFAAPFAPPVAQAPVDLGGDLWAVRFTLHPLGRPMRLFNTHRFRADDEPPDLSTLDRVPGPVPAARLTQDSPAGRPAEYILVEEYTLASTRLSGGEAGLVLHVPAPALAGVTWRFRGANLCAWEAGLDPDLRENEIVVDPDRG
ncbi:MAG TPA: phage tail protein, partial [Fibrobacteria bacterium]|nr:phage tail protein [Fibrobacteria bacterium]